MPRMPRFVTVLAIIFAAVRCGSAATTPSPTITSAAPSPTASPSTTPSPTPVPGSDPTAQGMIRTTLATEGFASRQHAQPFLGVWEARRLSPGESFVHPQTIPAVGYVAEGTIRWTTPSGSIDIKTGEGAGLPQLPITETNPGTAPSLWYAFTIAETGIESATLATMRRLAVGGRLPLPQPEGSYTIRLDLITLAGGGRTASLSHGGAALIFVLDGQVEIRAANGGHDFRGPKEGSGVAPGGAVQVLNRTSAPARLLAFFYTPDALAFETTLTTPP
jgi:hypothetical protein